MVFLTNNITTKIRITITITSFESQSYSGSLIRETKSKKMMNDMSFETEDTGEKQQTSPTYSIQSKIETKVTLVKCENSHHSANPAPQ